MSWARLDDLYDDHPKVKRAWRRHPRAVGLHAMAIAYCARHETDGLVDSEWIEEKIPKAGERNACLAVLIDVGLFDAEDGGGSFRVHDFLDYNQSREESAEKRSNLSRKRSEAGKRGARSRWQGDSKPDGKPMANADAVATMANGSRPDPTRPDPKKTSSEGDGKVVKLERKPVDDPEWLDWISDHTSVTGHTAPGRQTKAYQSLAESYGARRAEGYPAGDLKIATREAHADDYRREHGYDTAESVLRPLKIAGLISRGKRRLVGSSSRAESDALARHAAKAREQESA